MASMVLVPRSTTFLSAQQARRLLQLKVNLQSRLFSSSRRKERRQRLRQSVIDKLNKEKTAEKSLESERPTPPFWYYLSIWPDPHGYDPHEKAQNRLNWQKFRSEWRPILRSTIEKYKWTFEGWLLEEKDEGGEKGPTLSQSFKEKRKEVSTNLRKNTKFLQSESQELAREVQQRTGIYTMQDLRDWASRQMKLATECLNEFMAGYRKGRDDEVDKMVNEYFQELFVEDEAENKKKRRQPKRRKRTAA